MGELEMIENVEEESSSRQDIINKIIASGVNSLSSSHSSDDKNLLSVFVSQHFKDILPCWALLNENVQFYIFKNYVVEFESFMRSSLREASK